jgi:hypothetical protein
MHKVQYRPQSPVGLRDNRQQQPTRNVSIPCLGWLSLMIFSNKCSASLSAYTAFGKSLWRITLGNSRQCLVWISNLNVFSETLYPSGTNSRHCTPKGEC